MGVTPGSVHQETALVVADSLCECLRTLLLDDVAPSLLARLGDINLGAVRADDIGDDDLALEFGLPDLALDAAPVDGNVSEVRQELLGTVLAADQVEQLRGVIDESRPAISINEGGVGQEGGQEGDIGLDASDTELDKGTEDLSAGNFVSRAMA